MKQKWIVPIHTTKAPKFRIFAFCNGGAGASIYYPWKSLIADDVEFYAVQLPGRENRHLEPPILEMPLLIPLIADALNEFADLPFGFFGHSLGALLAFETTRELRRRGGKLPLALFLAGFPPPDEVLRPAIYQLPQEAFIAAIGKYYEPIPEAQLKHAKFQEAFLPVLRADIQLADTYQYREEPALNIPLWILGGKEDPLANASTLKGWSRQTTGPFCVKLYPGSHFFIQAVRAEVCQILLTQLNALVGKPV